ncbi:MAG TPA: glycosyltransferase [Candidatus Eisenbergiella merdipullorum]|uniref:Glycosyltransferase n=1 Tax=Candidatus Eisenbergiella merdipullorum TaxID=2838553 RepID=A0A9D2I5U1_9FIRM|nr:glycosyltransferase [Candidatus Eisenbergiella merdipullorum]
MDGIPKVSICIPAYNNEAEVRRLLASIAAQTMQDAEIILTDDSTNGKIETLVGKIRSGKDPGGEISAAPCMKRLRYVHNEKPLGHIFNWNKALSLARGKYIKIMFSDDWFTRDDSLEKLTALLEENPQASLAFCGTMQVSKKGSYARAAGREYVERLRQDYRLLFLGNEIGAPSATLYRACGAMFDERSNWASDMFLYFEILQKDPAFVFTPEPLISIGVHEEQYTESFSERDFRKYKDSLLMYEKYGLRDQEECRHEMLRLTVVYGQGWKTASACGAAFGEYLRQRAVWFWHNTVLGYWNGLLHKLGLKAEKGK